MSLRILVIGGTGLLGGPATRALVRAGHDVTVLTRGQRAVPEGAAAWQADRSDAESLARALSDQVFDVVVDLLAYDAEDVNRLLDVPGLRVDRVLMISTGQVYLVAEQRRPPFVEGDVELPAMPEPVPGTRDHANWVYGSGKREAETVLRGRADESGIVATALRLPVVQGADDISRRLWAYVQRMLDGGPVLLPGGGAHAVRFVWAEDVARAIACLVGRERPPAFAYNLAQPDEPSLSELLASVSEVLGCPLRMLECTWEEAEAAGLDHMLSPYSGQWCSRPDPALAMRDWGFAGTPSGQWLPPVVRAQLNERDPQPHPGYARRARELALAARLDGQRDD